MTTGYQDAPPLYPTAHQVAQYLRDNPSFLHEHPEILSLLLPERKLGENVEDLQFFTLKAMRHELNTLRIGTEEIIANARDNMSALNRTHAAVLALMTARSPADLGRILTEDLPILLQVDLSLLLWAEPGGPPALSGAASPLPSHTIATLPGDTGCALRPMVQPDPRLHGNAVGRIVSDALIRVPLGENCSPALLVLGTHHANSFHPDQETDLLIFLANATGACVQRWISA